MCESRDYMGLTSGLKMVMWLLKRLAVVQINISSDDTVWCYYFCYKFTLLYLLVSSKYVPYIICNFSELCIKNFGVQNVAFLTGLSRTYRIFYYITYITPIGPLESLKTELVATSSSLPFSTQQSMIGIKAKCGEMGLVGTGCRGLTIGSTGVGAYVQEPHTELYFALKVHTTDSGNRSITD